jgi:pimeloyl-ACP methyl ester carboxylesterase
MAFAINEKEKIPLCDFPQKIHIWSTNPHNRVILFLHGGPGVTNRAGILKQWGDLLDSFTLVAWDQRGTGGSYAHVDPSTLNAEQFFEDGVALLSYLSKRFQQKIFLVGGSWGTELGTFLCLRAPSLIAGYIGYGQVVNGEKNETISWNYTVEEATKAHDEDSLAILKRVGPPVKGQYVGGFSGLMAQRKILGKYGGHDMKKQGYFRSTAWPILKSTELSLADKHGIIKGYKLVLSKAWPSVCAYDFVAMAPKFAMPYYIFQGRHDENTPQELIQEYFNVLSAPKKELIWFENSAHSVVSEEPEKFKSLLRERFLAVNPQLG